MDFLQHGRETKAQLERQRAEAAKRQREQQQQAREELRKQKELKEKKERAKKQYYESIQQKYAQSALPEILESDAKKKDQARQERLALKSKREKAAQ